jgi:hypothetical protein
MSYKPRRMIGAKIIRNQSREVQSTENPSIRAIEIMQNNKNGLRITE